MILLLLMVFIIQDSVFLTRQNILCTSALVSKSSQKMRLGSENDIKVELKQKGYCYLKL